MAAVAVVMYGIAASDLAITLFQMLEAISLDPGVNDIKQPVNAAQIYLEAVNVSLR